MRSLDFHFRVQIHRKFLETYKSYLLLISDTVPRCTGSWTISTARPLKDRFFWDRSSWYQFSSGPISSDLIFWNFEFFFLSFWILIFSHCASHLTDFLEVSTFSFFGARDFFGAQFDIFCLGILVFGFLISACLLQLSPVLNIDYYSD